MTVDAFARPFGSSLATAACGVIAWRFIFPVPALFSLVLVLTLSVAYVVAR